MSPPVTPRSAFAPISRARRIGGVAAHAPNHHRQPVGHALRDRGHGAGNGSLEGLAAHRIDGAPGAQHPGI